MLLAFAARALVGPKPAKPGAPHKTGRVACNEFPDGVQEGLWHRDQEPRQEGATRDRSVLELWISDNGHVEAYGDSLGIDGVRIRDGDGSDLAVAADIVRRCFAAIQTDPGARPGQAVPRGVRVNGIAACLVYSESIASVGVFDANRIAIVSKPTTINTVEVTVIPVGIVRQCHAVLQAATAEPG